MLFAIICEDNADSEGLRKATRDVHLEYIGGHDVHLAGPMLSDDTATSARSSGAHGKAFSSANSPLAVATPAQAEVSQSHSSPSGAKVSS